MAKRTTAKAFKEYCTFQHTAGFEVVKEQLDALKTDAENLGDLPLDQFKHKAAALMGALFEIQMVLFDDLDIKPQMLAARIQELMALHGKEG